MNKILLAGLASCLCFSEAIATQCGPGFQPRGDICVSQRMSDFIACVEASGGNKKQLYSQIASSVDNGGGGKISGTASGIVVKGGGTVEVDKNAEERLNNTLSSAYFDRAMENCREALKDIAPFATPPIDPPKQAPAPQPTVTYKICSGEYESACQQHDVYLYCYTDVVAWAKNRCQSSSVSRYNTYGGNKCGYGMDLVTCVPASGPQTEPNKIKISDAQFAGDWGGQSKPVADILSRTCNYLEECGFYCNQNFLGETQVGTPKHCVITYTCSRNERDVLRLDNRESDQRYSIACKQ